MRQEQAPQPKYGPFFSALCPRFTFENEYPNGEIYDVESTPRALLPIMLATLKAGPEAPFLDNEGHGQEILRYFAVHAKESLQTDIAEERIMLSALKRRAKSGVQGPLHIALAGFIAAEHMPAKGYSGRPVPLPRKGKETPEHMLYRGAIELLRGYANDEYSRTLEPEKVFSYFRPGEIVRLMMGEELTPSEMEELGTRHTQFDKELDMYAGLPAMARSVLEMLQNNTPQEINDDLSAVYEEVFAKYGPRLEVDETGWIILPQEAWGENIVLGPRTADNGLRQQLRFIDWKRVERLKQYVTGWKGAYLAVASLESQGDEEYYVAVLPTKLGSLAIEHAIGDNPSSGNAVYAWRAEKGIDNNEIIMTWKGVFKQTKRIARALGARRMLHTENIEHNILDYLTRPAHQLEDPGYERQ